MYILSFFSFPTNYELCSFSPPKFALKQYVQYIAFPLINLTMLVANSKALAPLTTPHFFSESILNQLYFKINKMVFKTALNQISVSPCKSLLLGKKRNYNCK